ncbi:MAG: CPBP family intramembrane metalloprotease [Prolixibacteraceae bacterium]|jgi:membrane protease YdiL (CAAX protease family)|nr:CPBP family intramembrane metalloprotease [Prolixibacteraceae bacterium]
MKRILIIILLSTTTLTIFAQTLDSIYRIKPDRLPLWTVCVPGASYFHQKKYVEGSLFALLEVSSIYVGLKYKNELKSNNNSPYYNFPLAIGQQAFQIEKLANFRSHLEQVQYRHPDFKYDNISEKDLFLAPFKKENILTPITGIMVFVAGVTLAGNMYLGNQNNAPRISVVDQMSFASEYIPRNNALAMYCPLGLVQGWGAGISEEYLFRNWLMPLLDYKYGKNKGLIFSSLGFGAFHFQNYFKANSRETKNAVLLQVATTSLAGFAYGLDVQRRNYKIGPAVAAHAWYDMVVMVGSFLINPENNYLGVRLRIGIN